MKISQIAFIVVLSLTVAFITGKYVVPNKGNSITVAESAYDRVLRTGILRCGYADWPPYVFVKNAETGKVSGILPDVTEAIAAKLNLKVEWTENTGWGSAIESLRDHHVDAFCAGLWRNAERGRYVGYGLPIFYSAVYPYVRTDEHRFDKDLSGINQPDVHISAMDGEMSDVIAKTHFPKATEVSVPQLGQLTDILVNVTTHKADVVFNEPSFVNDYIKTNPGTLRLAQDTPFQVFQTSLGVDIRETQLREMLDSALAELQNQGVIDEILSTYSNDPKVFLRVAKPYQ
jgi:ABC-type amino acid transport substrate-binding protein